MPRALRLLPVALLAAACLSLAPLRAEPQVVGKVVEYRAGEVTCKSFLCYDPARPGQLPAVLVVPEWWGVDEYARQRATQLAALGYVALAVDMYGDGQVLATPAEAGKQAGAVGGNLALTTARFQAALAFLKQQPNVDSQRLAAVGFCFGGGIVLNMARQGLPLTGVACFHGSLKPLAPAAPGAWQAKIRVYNGADDKFIPEADIAAFKAEMAANKVDYQFFNLAGALHAFSNPAATELGKKFNLPIAYHPEAEKMAWQNCTTFLAALFAPAPATK